MVIIGTSTVYHNRNTLFDIAESHMRFNGSQNRRVEHHYSNIYKLIIEKKENEN